ncbi:hypothetical protein SAMN05443634_10786 [Chishuiella changwenlii]|nr:hypothetical protein SAMN05443634_10786 [Chishuiella changwenlii]
MFILLFFGLASITFSQDNRYNEKISEVKESSFSKDEFQKTCTDIKKVFETYDCRKDLNRRAIISHDDEDLIIHLKRKRLKLVYASHQKGWLYDKYQELVKMMDNK